MPLQSSFFDDALQGDVWVAICMNKLQEDVQAKPP